MARLKIRNVGPIKEIDIELNKINILMGPQSCGKSTLAKILSFGAWLDKKHAMSPTINLNGPVDFMKYHRLDDVYFRDNSYIEYTGDYIKWIYNGETGITIESLENPSILRQKILYIPSERNIISIWPNLMEYNLDDYIRNMIVDWYEVKRNHSSQNALTIPLLGVRFYNRENDDADIVQLQDGQEVQLRNTSSGQQSLIPLYTMFNHAIADAMNQTRGLSIKEQDALRRKIEEKENRKVSLTDDVLIDLLAELSGKGYDYSQLIIEEPEQNLFPKTQVNIIYDMLRMINESTRDHRIVLTTHSPYILYAVNNCMMGHIVSDSITDDRKQLIPFQESWIDPKSVSIWEIADGKIQTIQENDGLIGSHYFNATMKETLRHFDIMLEFYGDDE